MIFQVSLILALMCVCEALQITFTRSLIEERRELLSAPATKTGDLNSTQTFTSGFVRIDTFNTLFEKWIRAQVLPIGVCYQKGNSGGSAKIVEVTVDPVSISRTIEMYITSNCTERFSSESLTLAKEQVVEEFTHSIRHVSDIDAALTLEPATSDGLIIMSYLSSEGCSGEPSQYDIFITEECIVYDEPLGAYGTFQCDKTADMMVLTWYGIHDGEMPPVLLTCGVPRTSTKQMLGCTDQSAVKIGQEKSPLFQTVRCTGGRAIPV